MPKDSKPPAFPFYVDDFASDGKVEAMTTEEVGAYILLLCKAWREDPAGSLPADDRILSRWARLDSVRWHECKLAVLSTFDLRADGRLYQKRMEREARKMKENRRKRKIAASAAASKRWGDAKRMRNASKSHANGNAKSCLSISSSSSISSSEEKIDTKEAAAPVRVKFNAADAAIPEALNSQEFADAWVRWCRHRSDIKKPLTATSVDQQFRQFVGWGVQRSVKAIEFTILKGWQGIREDDSGNARTAGTGFVSSGPPEARQSELERRRAAQRERLGLDTEADR